MLTHMLSFVDMIGLYPIPAEAPVFLVAVSGSLNQDPAGFISCLNLPAGHPIFLYQIYVGSIGGLCSDPDGAISLCGVY